MLEIADAPHSWAPRGAVVYGICKYENNIYISGMKEEKIIVDINKVEETKKKKSSPNYALQRYSGAIKNLIELNMVDDKEQKMLKELGKKMQEKFIGLNMWD